MNQNSNFLGGRSCISGTNSVKRVLKGIFKPNDVLITVSKTSYAKKYTHSSTIRILESQK